VEQVEVPALISLPRRPLVIAVTSVAMPMSSSHSWTNGAAFVVLLSFVWT
jgi:hypothetical protein